MRRLFLCVLDIAGTEKLFGPPASAGARTSRPHAKGWASRRALRSAAIFMRPLCCSQGAHCAQAPVQVISAGEEKEALASLPLAISI